MRLGIVPVNGRPPEELITGVGIGQRRSQSNRVSTAPVTGEPQCNGYRTLPLLAPGGPVRARGMSFAVFLRPAPLPARVETSGLRPPLRGGARPRASSGSPPGRE